MLHILCMYSLPSGDIIFEVMTVFPSELLLVGPCCHTITTRLSVLMRLIVIHLQFLYWKYGMSCDTPQLRMLPPHGPVNSIHTNHNLLRVLMVT